MALTKKVNGVTVALSAEEEATVRAQWAASDLKQAQEGYKFKRVEAYPSISDQLDMIYWDKINGTTIWVDAITAVKTLYPKPV